MRGCKNFFSILPYLCNCGNFFSLPETRTSEIEAKKETSISIRAGGEGRRAGREIEYSRVR